MRAIAFDLDNTLWDVEPVLARAEAALQAWLAEHGPRIVRRLTPQAMRRAREELAQREPHNAHDVTYLRLTALAAHAREHGYDETLAQRRSPCSSRRVTRSRYSPTCCRRWRGCKRRFELGSLSNGNADLKRIGLDHLFAVSLNARELGAGKPERRCFERLASELDCRAHEILYVGDEPLLDVVAARAAGFGTVWMNRRALLWPQELAPRT